MARWVAWYPHRLQARSVLSTGLDRVPVQGFVHYKFQGEPTHLDVDGLNERLKPRGAVRLRQALKPDEAFGMIFNFDNVIVDTKQLQRHAWETLAQQENLIFPSVDRPQLYNMRPERAVTDVSGSRPC
jgi:hypothetical protein